MDYIKSVEPTLFPPCQLVLREQINEQAMYLDDLTYGLTLLDSGWQLNNGKIEVKWFDGEQVPTELEETDETVEDDDTDEDIEDEEDEDDEISDDLPS